MHLSGLLHHLKKPNAQELEVLASPVHQSSIIINTQMKARSVMIYYKKQQLPDQMEVVACPCKSLTESTWHFSASKALPAHSTGLTAGSGHHG